jgi:PAS domain S-box-containing protein
MFGYEADEWPGLPVVELVPEASRERHRRGFARRLSEPAGGPLHGMEVQARRKDGSAFPCELSISDYVDEVGRHFIVAVRDVSARKAAEEESARLRMAVEQTPEGVFITDAEGRIVYANPAVERMTGLSREELVGRLAAEAPVGARGDALFAEIMEHMHEGLPWLGDVTYTGPDGERRIVERHIAPVVVDGETRWHVCVDTDVTEQRRDRERLEHTQRLESLGVLAGGIAHDFNNLLAAIMGNAGLARMKAGANAEVCQYLKRIEDSSQRAADLCRQMLAYSGKGRFVVKPIDLSEMVREITNLLEVSIAKNVVLKFHLAENLPAVEADAAQLQQVIMNLVINASEAIGERSGVVSLSTGMMHADAEYLKGVHGAADIRPGRFVYLEVADTGCGMDEATIKRLFDPFFTTKFTGRGLGMSAVLGIVRGHHGAIKVYSEPGQGTTFKVLLPASKEQARARAAEEEWGDWCGVGTVLVVDDEETIRETASAMLEAMGFATLTAADGEEGVAVYREHCDEIVAVLLDMTMPRLDGKACFRELRRVNPGVRVILSSGYNEQDATSRFAGQGLAGFIQKPYAPEALREALRKVFEEES